MGTQRIVITGSNTMIISNSSTGKITVNGKEIKTDESTKTVILEIHGNIEKLQSDICEKIVVNGNAANIHTKAGNVEITGSVSGSISIMSGDVECGDVAGNISTMSGNVKHRKN